MSFWVSFWEGQYVPAELFFFPTAFYISHIRSPASGDVHTWD